MENETNKFTGFPPIKGNFWMFPRVLDLWRHTLTPQENLALQFILRRTVGFQKLSDKISLSQFELGLGESDKGTGMTRKMIIKAIRGLESKGFINVKRGGKINEYSLVLSGNKNSVQLKQDAVPGGNKIGVGEIHTIQNTIERIEKIYKIYSKYIRSGGRLTKEAEKNIGARLLEYCPHDLITAIRNASEHEPYWKLVVEKTTPAWFFQNEQRIEDFISLGPHERLKNEKDKEQ